MPVNPVCENCPQRNVCPQHDLFRESLVRIERSMRDGFDSVNRTLKEVAGDLRDGAIAMENMRTRLRLVEKVTYSAVGTALTGVLLAILALVLKGGA